MVKVVGQDEDLDFAEVWHGWECLIHTAPAMGFIPIGFDILTKSPAEAQRADEVEVVSGHGATYDEEADFCAHVEYESVMFLDDGDAS